MNKRLRFAMHNPRGAAASIVRRLFGMHHKVSIKSIKSQFYPAYYHCIEPASSFLINRPHVFGKTSAPHTVDVNCELLESYIANLHDVVAISRSTLVKTEKKSAVYDELAFLPDKLRYGLRLSGMSIKENGQIAKFTTWHRRQHIDQAIHLMHEASYNYFHWLIECLPRMAMIDKFPKFDSWPILIDKNLPSQFIDALQIFNTKNRPIIQVAPLEMVHVRNLAFASCQSIVRDNYDNVVSPSKDIIISPTAIQSVRTRICSIIKVDVNAPKKIYISRKDSAHRVVLNEQHIEDFLRQQDFAIINPGKLTFAQQVALFSQAQIIVSPTGAGLTNIIFAPMGCKVFCLISSNVRSNLYFFNTISQVLGQEFTYVIGPEISTAGVSPIHNDYTIDLNILKKALQS